MRLHRPSHATVVAYLALFFAMSGTALAATGNVFVTGRSNTASTVTSLTNKSGTALSISSRSGYPPLAVNQSIKIARLNADLLDGYHSSAFLGAQATAANANALQGLGPSAFLAAGGTATDSNALGGVNASGYQRSLSGAFVLVPVGHACPTGSTADGYEYTLTDQYGYLHYFYGCTIS